MGKPAGLSEVIAPLGERPPATSMDNLQNRRTCQSSNFLRRVREHVQPTEKRPGNRSGMRSRTGSVIEQHEHVQLILETPDGARSYDPRYGMDDLFNDGAQGQFMVKFLF
jgi:hypothetical protein